MDVFEPVGNSGNSGSPKRVKAIYQLGKGEGGREC